MRWHRRLSTPLSPLPAEKRNRSVHRVRLYLEVLETRALLSASSAASTTAATPLSDVTAQNDSSTVTPAASSTFSGYNPSQIQSAYGVPTTINGQAAGTGETIAIVDAYNDPNIQSNLATFDATYKLPTANLSAVNQNGSSALPANNSSWAVEESLDVEWAHAIAPGAKIVLVEANSTSLSDLMTAVQTASKLANVVSMSWGANEFNGETTYDQYFAKAGVTTGSGVTYVASAGDNSAYDGPEWPASSPDVLAVGGTTLNLTGSNTISSETAWSASNVMYRSYGRLYYEIEGGGGGISSYETAPSYQSGISVAQEYDARTTPDVAWDANPNTGVSVYDSYDEPGWGYVGGTSAGAPAWAGIVAIADQSSGKSLSTAEVENALYGVYTSSGGAKYTSGSAYSKDFNDITSGSNGYQATTGYDLATGLGSPKVSTLISSLFANTPSVSSSTISSTTEGTTTQTNHQRTWNGSAHPRDILGTNATVGTPSGISVSILVLSTTNVPTGFPTPGSVGGSTSAVSNLSSLPLMMTAPSMPYAGNSPVFNGSLTGSGTQSDLVFGASGWNGTALSWRMSSLGLSNPAMSELADDLSEDSSENRNDFSSPDAISIEGDTEELILEAAPPILLEGQVSDGVETAEGGAGSNGGDGGE